MKKIKLQYRIPGAEDAVQNVDTIQQHPAGLLPSYTSVKIASDQVRSVMKRLTDDRTYGKYAANPKFLFERIYIDGRFTIKLNIIDQSETSRCVQIQVSVIQVQAFHDDYRLCVKGIGGSIDLAVECFSHLCDQMMHLFDLTDDCDSDSDRWTSHSEDESETEEENFDQNILNPGDLAIELHQVIAQLYGKSRIKVHKSTELFDVGQMIAQLCYDKNIYTTEKSYKKLTQNYVFHLRYTDKNVNRGKPSVINKRRKKAIEKYKPEPTQENCTIYFAPRNYFTPKNNVPMRGMESGSNGGKHFALNEITLWQSQNITSITPTCTRVATTPLLNINFSDWRDVDAYELQNIKLTLQRSGYGDNYEQSLCKLNTQCRNENNANEAYTVLCKPVADSWTFTNDVFIGKLADVGTKWEKSLANKTFNILLLVTAAKTMITHSDEYQQFLLEQEKHSLERMISILMVIHFKCLDANQLICPETEQLLLEHSHMDFDVDYTAIYAPHKEITSKLVVEAIQQIFAVLLKADEERDENVFTECVDNMLSTLSSQGLSDKVHEFMQHVVDGFGYSSFIQCFK